MAPITAFGWDSEADSYELHVVIGDPPAYALGHLLLIDDGTGARPLAALDNLDRGASFQATTNLRRPADYGFSVAPLVPLDPKAGLLRVASVGTGAPLRNFVLRCLVTNSAGVALPEVRIRVHVHRKVQSLWLTPTTLTVPRDTTTYQASLLARFDDGVVGDVTNWGTVDWQTGTPFSVTATDLQQPFANGRIAVPADATVGATARLHATYAEFTAASKRASSDLIVGRAMSQLSPRIEPVGGHRNAPIAPPPEVAVPNILFVSEGWTAPQRSEFMQTVAAIVRRLDTNPAWIPFATLRDRMNYWACWVPSAQSGVGSRVPASIAPPANDEELNAEFVLEPVAPGGLAPADWDVVHLLAEFGPAVPADPVLDRVAQVNAWRARYATVVTDQLREVIFQRWARRRLGDGGHGATPLGAVCDLALLDEHDTAFGMTFGEAPGGRRINRAPALSSRRARSVHLKEFVRTLRLPDGSATRWLPGQPDVGLLAFVVRGVRRGGVNRKADDQPHVAISIAPDDAFRATSRADGGASFADVLVPGATLDLVHSFAHELCHSRRLGGLEDEYLEQLGSTFAGASGRSPDNALNTQSRANLAANGQNGPIVGDRIRWHWPRIRRAGLVAGQPNQPDATKQEWLIALRRGQDGPFVAGDLGHLRPWPLDLRLARGGQSVEFKILGKPAAGKLLLVATGAPFVAPVPPPEAWLFYVPTRSAATPAGSALSVVHDAVRQHIATTQQPLNQPANRATLQERASNYVMIPQNLPQGLRAPGLGSTANWVGLYDNAAGFEFGAFHPAGTCAMRRSGTLGTERFCHVCRYVMVDRVDPTRHGEIDRLYGNDYPPG